MCNNLTISKNYIGTSIKLYMGVLFSYPGYCPTAQLIFTNRISNDCIWRQFWFLLVHYHKEIMLKLKIKLWNQVHPASWQQLYGYVIEK